MSGFTVGKLLATVWTVSRYVRVGQYSGHASPLGNDLREGRAAGSES